jgi:NDP-sugar pyrophosphorylase family protein
MIINHKKNMIKAYFADNEKHTCRVVFIEENQPLGTGGGLGLIRSNIKETFFMTNCDIMIFEDYDKILERHRTAGNLLTMVCVTKQFSIPYGAVNIDDLGQIVAINEKPSFSMLANTGFYIIEPEMLEIVPENTFCHTTDLIQKCMDIGEKVGVYPVSEEKWADMGKPDEMERMQEKMELMNV